MRHSDDPSRLRIELLPDLGDHADRAHTPVYRRANGSHAAVIARFMPGGYAASGAAETTTM